MIRTESLEQLVLAHPIFRGMETELAVLIAGCARNSYFAAGAYLVREGAPADSFFLIREGRVAMEIAAPGRTPQIFSTPGAGEIVGISWLSPPYVWTFDARALTPLRAIAVDAACLRGKCERDPRLGYELLKRLSAILVARLHATRLQMFDVYRHLDA